MKTRSITFIAGFVAVGAMQGLRAQETPSKCTSDYVAAMKNCTDGYNFLMAQKDPGLVAGAAIGLQTCQNNAAKAYRSCCATAQPSAPDGLLDGVPDPSYSTDPLEDGS